MQYNSIRDILCYHVHTEVQFTDERHFITFKIRLKIKGY